MIFSAYQVNKDGEARFSKGILDAVDAAFTLDHWGDEHDCVEFKCDKMRSGKEKGFITRMNWETLRMGPETEINPDTKEETTDDIYPLW